METRAEGATAARLFGQTETVNGTGRFALINEIRTRRPQFGLGAAGDRRSPGIRRVGQRGSHADTSDHGPPGKAELEAAHPTRKCREPRPRSASTISSEIALLPGIPAEVAIGMEELATVSSGLEGIRIEDADRALLEAIPNFPASALAAIDAYRAGRIDRTQLVAELGLLEYHADGNAPSWRARLDVELSTGHRESYEALVAIAPDDTRPYRNIGLAATGYCRWAVKA